MRARWSLLALALFTSTACGSSKLPDAPAGPAPVAPLPPSDVAALDALVDRAWAEAGVTPAPPVDDATYLRRVSLDLVGRIASEDELRAFLADASSDKRTRAVQRLLASPEHDAHLARRWEHVLLGPEVRSPVVDRGALRRWLEAQFRENAPWSLVVRELVAAEGRSSLGGQLGPALSADDPERAAAEQREGIHGGANYTLRFARTPADLGGHVARTFLGVRIECARCHDHKTEPWKQDDYRAFSSALLRLDVDAEREGRGMLRVVELGPSSRPPRRMLRDEEVSAIVDTAPRTLDGTPLEPEGARAAMAAWITSTHNTTFRRAIVNRVWAELFGEGLVHPVDDLRPTNPAVMPEVLDHLAARFAASGDDLDALYQLLCASRAYQVSIATGEGTPRDQRFARASLRPLTADQLVDSAFVASGLDHTIAERAPARAQVLEARLRRRMGFVHDVDAESNAEVPQGSLTQALSSMHGVLTTAATAFVKEGALARLVRGRSDAEAIEALWLRTLGRPPHADELADALAFVAEGSTEGAGPRASPRPGLARLLRSGAIDARERAYEDLFWALLASSELHFRR